MPIKAIDKIWVCEKRNIQTGVCTHQNILISDENTANKYCKDCKAFRKIAMESAK